ncbi:MAG: hypothetical protein FWF06_00990 [Symbiobacteriaceae bacterium]|nr:hypothetical protein [Symbiobacteriaceae bacterium]
MRQLRAYWQEQKGYVTLFVLLYCLMAAALFSAEYFRLMGVQEEVEGILQRATTVTLEAKLRDPLRWDFTTELDQNSLASAFDYFLRYDCKLDSLYRRKAPDGNIIWRIEVTMLSTSANPPSVEVQGVIHTASFLSFLMGEVQIPFAVGSRTVRLD